MFQNGKKYFSLSVLTNKITNYAYRPAVPISPGRGPDPAREGLQSGQRGFRGMFSIVTIRAN